MQGHKYLLPEWKVGRGGKNSEFDPEEF